MRKAIVIAFMLLVLVTAQVQAAFSGRILYTKARSAAKDAVSDVYEHDLATGKSRILLAHESLPKELATATVDVLASPGGRYLLLGNPWVAFRQNSKSTDAGLWLYNSKSQQIWALKGVDVRASVEWSPSQQLLMVVDSGNSTVSLYDPVSRKMRMVFKSDAVTAVEWCSDGKHILVAQQRSKNTAILKVAPSGQKERLLTWSTAVYKLNQSPDGNRFWFYYWEHVIYLSSGYGKQITRLKPFPIVDNVDMLFNPSGSMGVVIAMQPSMPNYIGADKKLLLVNPKTGSIRKTLKWEELYDESNVMAERSPLGWATDNVMLFSQTMVDAMENRHIEVVSCDLSKPSPSFEKILDLGSGIFDVEYYKPH